MIANIDTISLLFLFLITIFYAVRFFAQIKTVKTQQVLIIVHVVGLFSIILGEVLLFLDRLAINHFEMLYRSIVTLLFSMILTQVSLISLREPTPKKIKTLWRIPFTGLLSGLYFELKYTSLLCAGYFALSFVILYGRRVDFRYLISRLILLAPAIVGIFYIKMNMLGYLNIMLIWFIICSAFIHNAANINSFFKLKE